METNLICVINLLKVLGFSASDFYVVIINPYNINLQGKYSSKLVKKLKIMDSNENKYYIDDTGYFQYLGTTTVVDTNPEIQHEIAYKITLTD